MSGPTSWREVQLLGGSATDRQLVRAELYRDYPASQLAEVQASWAQARQDAAMRGIVQGLAPLEHGHWDWRNKEDSVDSGIHILLAVECDGQVQGLMAVLRTPRPGKRGGSVVYVDYLETAPWNLKLFSRVPKFIGVGTVLIAEAVRLSMEMGLGGRIGLHSLPQAESFYRDRCQMTRIGPDPSYYDLVYFEFDDQQAPGWLVAIGGSL